jgi:hypothetical protein
MNCKQVQDSMDLLLSEGGVSLPHVLSSHVEKCSFCRDHLKDISALGEILDRRPFEVNPGELDDLTFQKIVALAREEMVRVAPPKPFWRRLMAPAAAVAVVAIVVAVVFMKGNIINTDDSSSMPYVLNGVEMLEQIASSDSLSRELLNSLASGDSDLEHIADELTSGCDIDDLISSLNTEELQALYDKLDNLKG